MKNNRRKKNRGDYGTPHAGKGAMAKGRATSISFNKHPEPQASDKQLKLFLQHLAVSRALDNPPVPENWDEDTTVERPFIILNADTYKTDVLFDIPPSRRAESYLLSPNKNWAYVNRVLPEGEPLFLFDQPPPSSVLWTGDVVLPMLIDMNVASHNGRRITHLPEQDRVFQGAVWMSLTPAEMLSQRAGIEKARGKVVVGGLGLGWFLRKVAAKPEVTEIIVVEKSKELLNWYGRTLCNQHPKVSEVIAGDVYNEIGRHGNCQYLLDIWLRHGDAKTDAKLGSAMRRFKYQIWAWGYGEQRNVK